MNISTVNPNYIWQSDEAATEYRIRIRDITDGIRIYDETHASDAVCTADSCSITPALDIDFGHRYYWRGRGVNATGIGAWSENGYIRPEKPVSLLLPSPIGDVTTASLEYRWTRQELATEYRLRIYDRTETAWVYDQTQMLSLIHLIHS